VNDLSVQNDRCHCMGTVPSVVFRRTRNIKVIHGICSLMQNFNVSTEFCGNSVLAGDIGDKYGIFWMDSGPRTVRIHDFTMKYI